MNSTRSSSFSSLDERRLRDAERGLLDERLDDERIGELRAGRESSADREYRETRRRDAVVAEDALDRPLSRASIIPRGLQPV